MEVSDDALFSLQDKVNTFEGGCISENLDKWVELTSDPEVLETVTGLPIELIDDLPSNAPFQNPFGIKEHAFVAEEITRLLDKKVIK